MHCIRISQEVRSSAYHALRLVHSLAGRDLKRTDERIRARPPKRVGTMRGVADPADRWVLIQRAGEQALDATGRKKGRPRRTSPHLSPIDQFGTSEP